ncbi:MAG TPA: VanW family protein [Chondromyces sp.]|nr:VanW family protein [Chondromyces sp.]
MKLAWIAGLLLLVQPFTIPDSLSVTQQGQTIATISRPDVLIPLPGTPVIHTEKFNQFIEKLDQQIYQAPVNATINQQGEILPGRIGYKLDRQTFSKQFITYLFGKGPSKIEVPKLIVYPKVDSELLADIRTQKIGNYVTYFNATNKERSHNISLAAKSINNHVVFPGETFSFNEVVGKRTAEKGYMRAPVIIRGELSEGLGGGICQVSSTLFNAVNNARMHIVERYSHSRTVPYVPPGRDAAVSWYGPDFRFKNKYNQPILIQAKTYGGSISIIISSSDVVNYEFQKQSYLFY